MSKTRIPMLLAAVIAVFAVTAAPALALKEFVAKPGSGTVKGKTNGAQEFKTKFGLVTCKEANAKYTVTAEKLAALKEVSVEYPKASCLAFGFVPTEITTEKYGFKLSGAATGDATLENEVKVTLSGCSLVVPANQSFTGVMSFTNAAANLVKAKSEVKELILYKGTGSLCSGEAKNGSYLGIEELSGNSPPAEVAVL